jgi:hypothetical protein
LFLTDRRIGDPVRAGDIVAWIGTAFAHLGRMPDRLIMAP